MALLWTFERRERWHLVQALLAAIVAGLQLHCPITDPWHLLAGHASVSPALLVLLAVGVSWVSGRRTRS